MEKKKEIIKYAFSGFLVFLNLSVVIYLIAIGFGTTYTFTYETQQYFGFSQRIVVLSPYIESVFLSLGIYNMYLLYNGRSLPLIFALGSTLFCTLVGSTARIVFVITEFKPTYTSKLSIKPWLYINKYWSAAEKEHAIQQFTQQTPYMDLKKEEVQKMVTSIDSLTIEQIYEKLKTLRTEALELLRQELARQREPKMAPTATSPLWDTLTQAYQWLTCTTAGNVVIGVVGIVITYYTLSLITKVIRSTLMTADLSNVTAQLAKDQDKIQQCLNATTQQTDKLTTSVAELSATVNGGSGVQSVQEIQRTLPKLSADVTTLKDSTGTLARRITAVEDINTPTNLKERVLSIPMRQDITLGHVLQSNSKVLQDVELYVQAQAVYNDAMETNKKERLDAIAAKAETPLYKVLADFYNTDQHSAYALAKVLKTVSLLAGTALDIPQSSMDANLASPTPTLTREEIAALTEQRLASIKNVKE